MATKAELRAKHGTPEEFERAVWKAYNQFFVTMEEAQESISKYREEYLAATETQEVEKAKETIRAALDEAMYGVNT